VDGVHLAIDIAKSAKCEVTGITLSENQFNYCKQKSKRNEFRKSS
jgi:cyclopropane-fatty-acyl-phospholipid synthase